MFDRRGRISYVDQKSRRYRKRWFVFWTIGFFLVYSILSAFIFSAHVMQSNSMQPTLLAGERFVFSSYRMQPLKQGAEAEELSLKRGNIVIVDRFPGNKSVLSTLTDTVLRFFTFQRFGLRSNSNFYIKRVVGLPGDEVSITNFIVRIKPKDSSFNFTESELWDRPYEPYIPSVPALWDESFPFSGSMESIILGEDEFFVLSDDRSNTNDSRSWGNISAGQIQGKLLFRYWPLNRIGKI